MTTVYEGPGQCECECANPVYPHSCKGYASKPFSGWCALQYPDAEVHYLAFGALLIQAGGIAKKDEYGVTQETVSFYGQRTINISRNRYTNKQTVYLPSPSGWWWGALCWVVSLGRYIHESTPDDYLNWDEVFIFGPDGPGFSESYDILAPYKGTWNGQTAIVADYFTDSLTYFLGMRIRTINVSFAAGPNEYGGQDEYTASVTISEALDTQYTITACNSDQSALVSANSFTRLKERSVEPDFTVSYCGYDDAGTIIFDDDYDGTGLGAGFYPIAPYDGVTGLPSDPTTTWSDTTLYHLADQQSTVQNYHAAAISLPLISGGMVVNACTESKSIFIEESVSYDIKTYEWLQTSAVGALTDTDTFIGVAGHETDIDCTMFGFSAKTITETP